MYASRFCIVVDWGRSPGRTSKADVIEGGFASQTSHTAVLCELTALLADAELKYV